MVFLTLMLSALLLLFLLDRYVALRGGASIKSEDEAPQADVIVVFGAQVHADGRPSLMLADRLTEAARLYERGLAPLILVSGDNRAVSYHETDAMRRRLLELGVPAAAIVCDEVGYDTYTTIHNAHFRFGYERLLLTTQTFHLERALYLADRLGIPAAGVPSDLRRYRTMPWNRLRDALARIKAVYEGWRQPTPGPLD